jgi:2-methylisocitrate lyase-like PEP mutase family enzyme
MPNHTRKQKAERFRDLHHNRELLILPNVWDPVGARLLEGLGFRAIATASAAVSWAEGVHDGEKLPFSRMVEVVDSIVKAVDVPVTADLESGYAVKPRDLGENIRRALETGIAGVNLEDTNHETGKLYSLEDQVDRLRAVRAQADGEGIPLVINARTDVFIRSDPKPTPDKMDETIRRGRAYLEAGADCLYPIILSDLDALKTIHEETGAPINVYASASAPSIVQLEAAGIARLSLGPGLFKASLTTMKQVGETLLAGGPYTSFTDDVLTTPEVQKHVVRDGG